MAMRHGVSLIPIVILGGCAGRALATAGTATSPMPAPQAYACIQQQIKSAGFAVESRDDSELRIVARKYDPTARRPDTQFRRLVDRVAFSVVPAGGDSVTAISAEASTFAELTTHRGPTEQQERTSDTAKEAAQTILAHCTTSR